RHTRFSRDWSSDVCSSDLPPHNLGEVCDALVYMLDRWEEMDHIDVTDLMQFVKGPDFPTGGFVYRHLNGSATDEDSLVSAYSARSEDSRVGKEERVGGGRQ